jgi:cholesterol transport system auxiliary component
MMRIGKRSFRGAMLAILACAGLLSGCVSSLLTARPPDTYDLAGPADLSRVKGASSAQVLVPSPSALKILDSQRIVVTRGSLVAYYPNAQYADTLPRVVQARVIEAFERTKQAKAVGRPGEGLSIDYQLLTDLRTFGYVVGPTGQVAQVEISARLMNDRTGRVVAFKVFNAEVPVAADNAPSVVASLNAALDEVLVDLVSWSLSKI